MEPCVARPLLLAMQAGPGHRTRIVVLPGRVSDVVGRCLSGRLSSLVWELHYLVRCQLYMRLKNGSYIPRNRRFPKLALMKHVAERAVVQYHDLAQIRLHRA